LLSRCKQRGILELDMIVGTWAEKNVDRLTKGNHFNRFCFILCVVLICFVVLRTAELDDLEIVTELESPDLLKILTQPVRTLLLSSY
jgi:hypothetical protein